MDHPETLTTLGTKVTGLNKIRQPRMDHPETLTTLGTKVTG